MIKLKDLIPINLLVEKEKFFANETNYNPQFQYEKKIEKSDLAVYGRPRWQYSRLAKKILKQAKKEQLFIKNQKPAANLDQELSKQIIVDYLNDYSLAEKYQIIFNKDFTSRFAVNFKENAIKIRLPINFTSESLENTLNHEIGTHILRQENYLKQAWYRRKRHFAFSNHLRTEEGLAVIHQYLNSEQQLIYKTALLYLGAQLANRADFKTVYQFFYQNIKNPQRAWSYTLKTKRGLTDTSLPGGFSKSLVYLEGFKQVLKYLRHHNYDPSPLYYGKLAIKDIKKAKKMNPQYQVILPKFYSKNPLAYQEKVKKIAKRNFIF
ncbi:MAG: DUF1704 domain-containing protein [Candidatus Pacebacteria bacterium]|jgi:hypothetical protein|nr:DUF1704 domain-containing protein [Candidatus Paceibacterota bacterium]